MTDQGSSLPAIASAAGSLVLRFDIDCDSRLEVDGEVVGEDGDFLDELFYQSFVELCDICFLLGDKILQLLYPVHGLFPVLTGVLKAVGIAAAAAGAGAIANSTRGSGGGASSSSSDDYFSSSSDDNYTDSLESDDYDS